MLNVIAHIKTMPGARDRVLALLDALVPTVLAETGCGGYQPLIDLPLHLLAQTAGENDIVIVEKWESVAALEAHLRTPHMLAYHATSASWVEEVSVRLLGR